VFVLSPPVFDIVAPSIVAFPPFSTNIALLSLSVVVYSSFSVSVSPVIVFSSFLF